MSAKFVIDGNTGLVHMALNTKTRWETLCHLSAQEMADSRTEAGADLCHDCGDEFQEIQARMAARFAMPGGGHIPEIERLPLLTWDRLGSTMGRLRAFLYGS